MIVLNWPNLTISTALAGLIVTSLAYTGFLAVYRLYFSPISKFPGPKLAALTLWYEFYYDAILGGQYTFRIREMHIKYGPIVRINPYELHVSDPSFYEVLYTSSASGEKRDKWGWYAMQFGTPGATFSTVSHNHHRLRRSALNKFVSTASVAKLQPLIRAKIRRFISRFKPGETIQINIALAALTGDVVMEYAYGRSDNRVEQADWAPKYHDSLIATCAVGVVVKHMIWILHFIESLPEWLTAWLSSDLELMERNKSGTRKQIMSIMAESTSKRDQLNQRTIFHEILQSKLPDEEKSVTRLTHEAQIVVGAGTVTTSWAITVATFHLITSPPLLRKLKAELKAAIPDPEEDTPLHVLEKLPYLGAVIQEALRLSYGVPARLQRISPDRSLVFNDTKTATEWTIPAGTPVGMSSALVHHEEDIFPDSHAFQPERWIANPGLEKYQVAFSKGSRQCLGMNLAIAEMFMTLAMVWRRFGSAGPHGVRGEGDLGVLELHETDISDVEIHQAGFLPLPKKGSKGVFVKVRE